MLKLYRIPFSTNVERVALALAHKGVPVEYVDVDPGDRSPVVEVSGQELVPVLIDGERVISDSRRRSWSTSKRASRRRGSIPPLPPAAPRCACSLTGSTRSGSGRRT